MFSYFRNYGKSYLCNCFHNKISQVKSTKITIWNWSISKTFLFQTNSFVLIFVFSSDQWFIFSDWSSSRLDQYEYFPFALSRHSMDLQDSNVHLVCCCVHSHLDGARVHSWTLFCRQFPIETHVEMYIDIYSNNYSDCRCTCVFVLHLSIILRGRSWWNGSMSRKGKSCSLFDSYQHNRHYFDDVHSVSRCFNFKSFDHSKIILFKRISSTRFSKWFELSISNIGTLDRKWRTNVFIRFCFIDSRTK